MRAQVSLSLKIEQRLCEFARKFLLFEKERIKEKERERETGGRRGREREGKKDLSYDPPIAFVSEIYISRVYTGADVHASAGEIFKSI